MDSLPLEILLIVFGYLDKRSLRNLTLTRKFYNEIITNEISLWRDKEIYIDKNELGKYKDFPIKTYYRFLHPTCRESDVYLGRANELIHAHSLNIKKCAGFFINGSFLKHFVSLESLNCNYCDIDSKYFAPLTSLTSLQCIRVPVHSEDIVKLTNLEKLVCSEGISKDRLKSLTKLKEFQLRH